MEKNPQPQKRDEDFATDLTNPEEIDRGSQNLGLIDTVDGVHINPESVDDVVGSGGLVDFLTGVLKQVIKHLVNSS